MVLGYVTLPALLLAMTASVLVPAQNPSRQPAARMEDPHSLVRGWYRQFLDREPHAAGFAAWVTELGKGQDPAL